MQPQIEEKVIDFRFCGEAFPEFIYILRYMFNRILLWSFFSENRVGRLLFVKVDQKHKKTFLLSKIESFLKNRQN